MITNKTTRMTEQRRIILDDVLSRCDHPTADEIYQSVHKKHPNISVSTVYRNLDILAQEGKILRINIPSGDRFDLTTKKHYHVICKCCGKVVDACMDEIDDLNNKVQEKTGFIIDAHTMVFEGICPDCQKN